MILIIITPAPYINQLETVLFICCILLLVLILYRTKCNFYIFFN